MGVNLEPPAPSPSKITDAIPRVALEQLFSTLRLLASRERATFDDVRLLLQQETARRVPGSREAMWTSARDALAELQRLGLAKTGPLPRKRSEVDRLRGSPCELTSQGRELATRYQEKPGYGFDSLLIQWVNEHPYFRAYLARLGRGPMHVPDITSVKQVGEFDAAQIPELVRRIVANCAERLRPTGWTDEQLSVLEREIRERLSSTLTRVDPASLHRNAKAWVDIAQDSIVLPAFLLAENLPFDTVTFQHIIRISQQFLAAAWTSSHPGFTGRVVFSTCDFIPPIAAPPTTEENRVREVCHRGRSWATERFESALIKAHTMASAGRAGAYVDVYVLRALVCTELGIQPKVFELCLNDIARTPQPGRPLVYTELPMRPPPAGETYVELGGHRIGLVKLVP